MKLPEYYVFALILFLLLFVAIPAIYFMVYSDKSQDKTALLFAEFKMKLIFSTLI
jgi:hypothetical protein